MSVLTRSIRKFLLAAACFGGSLSLGVASLSAQQYHPFAEPLQFNPDWQWMAPAHLQDVEELTSRQRARHGWFATYDRVNLGFNRPDGENQSTEVDFTWGNRFEFGWMNDRDRGWHFGLLQASGPNVYDELRQPRLNLFDTTDTLDPVAPRIPRDFGDDPQENERIYYLRDSLNAGKYSHFEVNRMWRKEPYRYGGIIEPMVGLRYANFMDTAENDTYNSFAIVNAAGQVVANQEVLLQDIVNTENHMLLGQIGWHYFNYYKRWTLSNDFKVFAGPSFQSQHTALRQRTTTYPAAIVIGGPPTTGDDPAGSSFTGRHNDEFAVGFDLRLEAAYQVTKAFELRSGFQMLYVGQGIWRGATISSGGDQFDQSQDLVMPGFTFGLTLNR
jgi:hypothetical protein